MTRREGIDPLVLGALAQFSPRHDPAIRGGVLDIGGSIGLRPHRGEHAAPAPADPPRDPTDPAAAAA